MASRARTRQNDSNFWVPSQARWSYLKRKAKQSTIGQLVDDAMTGIEDDNAALNGMLPKNYARPGLDKTRLSQVIDMISNIQVGDAESRAKLEARWQRGQSLPGLPAKLCDPFPDRFTDSELGEIPEGWDAGTLADIADLNPESWTKKALPEEVQVCRSCQYQVGPH